MQGPPASFQLSWRSRQHGCGRISVSTSVLTLRPAVASMVRSATHCSAAPLLLCSSEVMPQHEERFCACHCVHREITLASLLCRSISLLR